MNMLLATFINCRVIYSSVLLLSLLLPGSSFAVTNIETQKLLASDGFSNIQFGISVAGDGDTVVIGAFRMSFPIPVSGRAFVYTRSAGVWTQQQKLAPADPGFHDQFGVSVAIDGDTIVVGSFLDDDNGDDSGSAYVYTRTAGVWSQQQKLLASDGAMNDQFGTSVSLSGDTLVIGALLDDDNGTNSGSAYVYTRTAGVWSQQQKLLAGDGASDDIFGNSVAIDGDSVIVGAHQVSTPAFFAGAAYVYTRTGGVWTEQQKLTSTDVAFNDQFGISVAINGDTAVIGAQGDDDVASAAGTAFVFTRAGGVWTQQQKLIALDGIKADKFGNSVAIDGDTVLIGAYSANNVPSQPGAAYVFSRNAGAWSERTKLLSSDRANEDRFAVSVGLLGDTAVIGAHADDDQGTNSGSAYIFSTVPSIETPAGTDVAVEPVPVDENGDPVLDAPQVSLAFDEVTGGGETTVTVSSNGPPPPTGLKLGSPPTYFELETTAEFTGAVEVCIDYSSLGFANENNLTLSHFVDPDGMGPEPEQWVDTTTSLDIVNDIICGSISSFSFFSLFEPLQPVADAGLDQTVSEDDFVTLDGSASSGVNPLNFTWTQVAGLGVTLDLSDPVFPTFRAPFVNDNTTLTFELVVDDSNGASDPMTVNISVVDVNTAPVADAGNDSTIKEGAIATLDGSLSFDLELSALTYEWTQVGGNPVSLVPDGTAVGPTFVAPVAAGMTLVFQLQVMDVFGEPSVLSPLPDTGIVGDDLVSVSIVLNSPPVADSGPDQTRDEGSLVNLDGSASADSDGGDTLSFAWIQVSGFPVFLADGNTATPSFSAPAVSPGGEAFEFSLVVTDDDPGNPLSSVPDTVVINVRNINDPPTCALASPDTDSLWPPDHRMSQVSIDGVMDPDSTFNAVTLTVTGITQDEPVNGLGDGDSSPDGVVQPGDPSDTVLLRHERDGSGNGRVYRIYFTASDGFESCDGSVDVSVPKSRGGQEAIDDGQDFLSTLP